MTIAACYVSHEGVVFGADSTTTVQVRNEPVRVKADQIIVWVSLGPKGRPTPPPGALPPIFMGTT